jgi:hypothetical protein
MSLVMDTDSSQEKALPDLSPAVVNKEAHDEERCVIKDESAHIDPEPTVDTLEQWNNPRINTWRFLATLLSFLMMGGNDGAFGVWPSFMCQYTVIDIT